MNCWTLDKPMASLSTCHLELVVWDGNLGKILLNGSSFHNLLTLSEKLSFLTFVQAYSINNFKLWPLVSLSLCSLTMLDTSLSYFP